MTRRLDLHLQRIRGKLDELYRQVDKLVGKAMIALEHPADGFGRDAEIQDVEVNELERQLHELVKETSVRFQPVANDLRFLISATAIGMHLEHMGDCAKRICGLAPKVYQPVEGLLSLLLLARKQSVDFLRALHRLDLADLEMFSGIAADRAEHEAIYERVLLELEVAEHFLSCAEPVHQPLVAYHLKRIADYAANIADQLVFYRTGGDRRVA